MIALNKQYNELITLKREIVSTIMQNRRITEEIRNSMYALGSDRGFAKDDVKEIIEDCKENLPYYQQKGEILL